MQFIVARRRRNVRYVRTPGPLWNEKPRQCDLTCISANTGRDRMGVYTPLMQRAYTYIHTYIMHAHRGSGEGSTRSTRNFFGLWLVNIKDVPASNVNSPVFTRFSRPVCELLSRLALLGHLANFTIVVASRPLIITIARSTTKFQREMNYSLRSTRPSTTLSFSLFIPRSLIPSRSTFPPLLSVYTRGYRRR